MPTKEEIREQLLEQRHALAPEAIQEMSRQIAFKLYQQDEFLEAGKVHIFTSFGSEPDTHAIREYALHLKKTVYVPVIERERREFHNVQVQPGMKYEPGLFGIPNPVFKNTAPKFLEKSELHLSEKDVVIVPLLAFNGKLHRIGYGHGYYDRFLNRNPAFTIGIAFDSQRIEDIPTEDFDVSLDMIITEKEVLRAVPVEARDYLAMDTPPEEEIIRSGARSYGLPDEAIGAKAFDMDENPSQAEKAAPEAPQEEVIEAEKPVEQTPEVPMESAEIAPKPVAKKTFGDDDIPGMPKRDDE